MHDCESRTTIYKKAGGEILLFIRFNMFCYMRFFKVFEIRLSPISPSKFDPQHTQKLSKTVTYRLC